VTPFKGSPKPKRSTYDRALDLLEARARGVTELHRLLIRKGESQADVDDVIVRLQRSGLLDDAMYARQFARSKALGAGLSRRRLQQELTKRGIAREVCDAAINDVFEQEGIDDSASIERVARKKLKTLDKLDMPAQRRRLFAFLARRGYDSDDIATVTQALLQTSSEN
jgi:regulatory protein